MKSAMKTEEKELRPTLSDRLLKKERPVLKTLDQSVSLREDESGIKTIEIGPDNDVTIETHLQVFDLHSRKKNEVLGVLYIAFALMILAGMTLDSSGRFETMIRHFVELNGLGPVFVALFALFCGIKRFLGRAVFETNSQILSFPLMYFSFIGLMSALAPDIEGKSLGGIAGNAIVWFLQSFLGKVSTGILLMAVFLISFMHVTDIYVSELFKTMTKLVTSALLRIVLFMKISAQSLKKGILFLFHSLHSFTYTVISAGMEVMEKGFSTQKQRITIDEDFTHSKSMDRPENLTFLQEDSDFRKPVNSAADDVLPSKKVCPVVPAAESTVRFAETSSAGGEFLERKKSSDESHPVEPSWILKENRSVAKTGDFSRKKANSPKELEDRGFSDFSREIKKSEDSRVDAKADSESSHSLQTVVSEERMLPVPADSLPVFSKESSVEIIPVRPARRKLKVKLNQDSKESQEHLQNETLEERPEEVNFQDESFSQEEESMMPFSGSTDDFEGQDESREEELEQMVKRVSPQILASNTRNTQPDRESSGRGVEEWIEEIEEDEGDLYLSRVLPEISFLKDPPVNVSQDSEDDLWARGSRLVKALDTYKVSAILQSFVQGPTITRFELKPAPGTKLNKIVSLTNEIAMNLSAKSVRIEAPIPGTPMVGVEIPNANPVPVYFKEAITAITGPGTEELHPLTIAFGKGIDGTTVVGNLAKMPHVLVAGSTGSGKSVCINTLISSILFRATPDQVKFVMIDPKQVELAVYRGIPHLITDVVTNPEEAAAALLWGVEEMETRYTLLSNFGVRHIDNFNKKLLAGELQPIVPVEDMPTETLPYVVIIVDELADLMMVAKKDVETSICRIAQKARAVGIHLVIATQRPSVDVITGLIKANLPSRIAFMVNSGIDSKTILNQQGAEHLLGRGDMLYFPGGQPKPERVQGAFMTDDEVAVLVQQIKDNFGEASYQDIVTKYMQTEEAVEENPDFYDDKFNLAIEVAMKEGYVSTSMLQRHLGLGYNRAARIVDQMFARGMCGNQESGKKRKMLIGLDEMENYFI